MGRASDPARTTRIVFAVAVLAIAFIQGAEADTYPPPREHPRDCWKELNPPPDEVPPYECPVWAALRFVRCLLEPLAQA